MHSVIYQRLLSRGLCGGQHRGRLFSYLCVLLFMASPWRTSAASSSTSNLEDRVPLSINNTLPPVASTTVPATVTATGIARLKEALNQGEDGPEVGHLEIREASGEAYPKTKDKVKYASGLWLARSKRSASNYLHHNMPWKRRGPRKSQMSSESENHATSANSDYSISSFPDMPSEMLMAAGRSMAVQMMKKRRPPGGNGGHAGRMYDVPQIGKSIF